MGSGNCYVEFYTRVVGTNGRRKVSELCYPQHRGVKQVRSESYKCTRKGTPGGCMCVCTNHFSRVQLFRNPWTTARKAPLSMGFSRQESWSGLPCPPPGDLPDPGIEPTSPALQVDSLPLSHGGSPIRCQINGNKWVVRHRGVGTEAEKPPSPIPICNHPKI